MAEKAEEKLPGGYRNKDGRVFRASPVLHRLADKMRLVPCEAPVKEKKPAAKLAK